MIRICQICGRRLARIYDDDTELALCLECSRAFVRGDDYDG